MTHSTASATTAGGMGTWPVTVGPGTTGASMEGATAAESEGTWPETASGRRWSRLVLVPFESPPPPNYRRAAGSGDAAWLHVA